MAGVTDAFVSKFGQKAVYVEVGGDCGGATPCYHSIQDALEAATTGTVILLAGGTYDEDLVLDQTKSLTLEGGWDPTFTTRTSFSTVNSLTITAGTVTTLYLVIR